MKKSEFNADIQSGLDFNRILNNERLRLTDGKIITSIQSVFCSAVVVLVGPVAPVACAWENTPMKSKTISKKQPIVLIIKNAMKPMSSDFGMNAKT